MFDFKEGKPKKIVLQHGEDTGIEREKKGKKKKKKHNSEILILIYIAITFIFRKKLSEM